MEATKESSVEQPISLEGDMIDSVLMTTSAGSSPGYDPGVIGMPAPQNPETKEIGTSYVGSLGGMPDATRVYIREIIEPSGKISAVANIQPIYTGENADPTIIKTIETISPDGTVRTRDVPAPVKSPDAPADYIFYQPVEVKLEPGEIITKATAVTGSGATAQTSVVDLKPELYQSYQFVSWCLSPAGTAKDAEKKVHFYVSDTFNAGGSREKVGRALTVIEPVLGDGVTRTVETVTANGTIKTYPISFPADAVTSGYSYPEGRRVTIQLEAGEWPRRVIETSGSGDTAKTSASDFVLGYDYLGTISRATELRPKTLGNGEWGEMRLQMREEIEPGGRVSMRSISVFGSPNASGTEWPARTLETIDANGVIHKHEIKPQTFEKYLSARMVDQYVFMNIGADEQPLRVVDNSGAAPKVFELNVVPIDESGMWAKPGFDVVNDPNAKPLQASHPKLVTNEGESNPGVYTIQVKYDSPQSLEDVAAAAKSKGAEVSLLPSSGSTYGFEIRVKDAQTLYNVLDLPNVVSGAPQSLYRIMEMAKSGTAVPPLGTATDSGNVLYTLAGSPTGTAADVLNTTSTAANNTPTTALGNVRKSVKNLLSSVSQMLQKFTNAGPFKLNKPTPSVTGTTATTTQPATQSIVKKSGALALLNSVLGGGFISNLLGGLSTTKTASNPKDVLKVNSSLTGTSSTPVTKPLANTQLKDLKYYGALGGLDKLSAALSKISQRKEDLLKQITSKK